jgi:hypothetical protein
MDKVTPEERLAAIKNLVKLYEVELRNDLAVEDSFDITKLPSIIQDGVSLVTAKSPAFSNISAATTVNYLFMHLVSQLRPTINDMVYSPDNLGINYYGINLSPSGNGKDASLNTMKSACKTAFDLILKEREDQEVDRAKRIALSGLKTDNPNITIEEVTFEQYTEYIRDLPPITIESKSTRGGSVNVITRLQNQKFGNLGLVANEFGLALKQNNTIEELLEMLGSLFDMGVTEQQAFKTAEVREQAIEGMYPNTLLHSSPKIVFGNDKVRTAISNLFHTMLARRCFFSMPTEEETIENNDVPETIAEVRAAADDRRVRISTLSTKIDNISSEVIRTMLVSDENRMLAFDEEAKILYTDYFEYNLKRGELVEDSSIKQVELNGRAFKVARLAALWALMSNTNEISRKVLASAIYFAEYNSKYIDTFISLTTSKSWKLLGDMFKEGKFSELSLDKAITNGYIYTITRDFRELLEPMNSYLRHIGTVVYEESSKKFIYTAFKRVDPKDGYGISYTKVPGMPKAMRVKHLDGFDSYLNMNIAQLTKLVATDTIYNVFRYNDAPNKEGTMIKMNRNRDNIASTTKILTIDVDDSTIPMDQMHDLLNEYPHVIATTSDVNNKMKFRILLPISVEIEGTDSQLYKCIMKSVCEELLVAYDPTSCNTVQPMYGYEGAEVLSCNKGAPFSVDDIVTNCLSNVDTGLVQPAKPVTPAAQKKLVDSMMANANQVFDYVISCPNGRGSLRLARASMHMLDSGFSQTQYMQVMQYLNSLWQNPMPEQRMAKIVAQYVHQMKGD